MSPEYIEWFRSVRHPTLPMAWEGGEAHIKAQVVAMLEQQILLERDKTLTKLADAVREL